MVMCTSECQMCSRWCSFMSLRVIMPTTNRFPSTTTRCRNPIVRKRLQIAGGKSE